MDIDIKWKKIWPKLAKAPTMRVLPNIVVRFNNKIQFGVQQNRNKDLKINIKNLEDLINEMNEKLRSDQIFNIKKIYHQRLKMDYFENDFERYKDVKNKKKFLERMKIIYTLLTAEIDAAFTKNKFTSIAIVT